MSYAAIYGMRKDLGLVGQDYSWVTSIFYFGYLVAEAPASYLLAKFTPRTFASTAIFLWGVMVILCAATKVRIPSGIPMLSTKLTTSRQNFAGIMVLRFLMGVFEAGIGPCWIALTSMFYKNDEQGARMT